MSQDHHHPPHLPHRLAVFRARRHLRQTHPDASFPVIEEALAQVVNEDAELKHMFYHEPERAIDIALMILQRDFGGESGNGAGLYIINGERVSTLPI